MERKNILKIRDDSAIIQFKKEGNNEFKLLEGTACSWMNPNNVFTRTELRERIEPWLTALFQAEHLSLLAGAGLSKAITSLTPTPDKNSKSWNDCFIDGPDKYLIKKMAKSSAKK